VSVSGPCVGLGVGVVCVWVCECVGAGAGLWMFVLVCVCVLCARLVNSGRNLGNYVNNNFLWK
jgi:hypothetical protein